MLAVLMRRRRRHGRGENRGEPKADISFAAIKRLYQHCSVSPHDEHNDEAEQKVRRLDRFESHLR
jgi:hypothetical protein